MSISFPLHLTQTYDYNETILSALGTLLNYYTEAHAKTLVVRFDIRYPENYTEETKRSDISRCMQKIIQRYKRQGYDPQYMWTAEQSTSVHPHYHCVLFINGNMTQNPYHVFQTVESLWGSTIGVPAQGLIHYCTQGKDGTPHENGIMLRRADSDFNDKLQAVQRQVSYLAKSEGKGEYNDGMRDFGISRIPKTNTTGG